MKAIVLTLKNSGAIEIEDDDDSDIQSYSENLSKILDSNNITILHATSGSVILRPNEITSISVYETEDEFYFDDETSETMIQQEEDKDEEESEIHEDIITD